MKGALGARRRRGFTLLEVMVAVTIFSILTVAVYSTFRVGLRSYETGREQMELIQSSRVAFDLLGRDLRAIFYLDPKEYNLGIRSILQQRAMAAAQQQGQTPGMPSINLRDLGMPDPNDPEGTGLPPGVPIDLTIIGASSRDGGDILTFAAYQANWGAAPVQPWALARVKYWIEDGNLFRAEGPVNVDRIPSWQWEPPALPESQDPRSRREAPEPAEPMKAEDYIAKAPRELVARKVKQFDLKYGYWTPDGWQETEDWTAHDRRYRNPPMEIDPRDPNAQMIMQQQMMRPTDGVPAYVKVRLVLLFGKDNERERIFEAKIRLFSSSEVHEPLTVPQGMAQPNVGMVTQPRP